MNTPTHDVPVRSARDRIIDLLGIGDTYPLTDLNVVADQLKVAFGGTAKIPIENAQAGVTYQLCDPKGQPLGDKFKADGNDETLVIETPTVLEDVTYRIQAAKKPHPGSALLAQAPRFLDESAPVKVGIDTRLVIEILNAPPLDPANPNPRPSDPRIVPYDKSVDVRVNKSQEGVQYSLILGGRDVEDVLTGNLGPIVLPTGPMVEDVVIQVRATKNYAASENKSPETSPLDAKLYLKVMANPKLVVSVDPLPILDYQQDATIKIAKTQPSAKYWAYIRTIPDVDFVHGETADPNIVTVAVEGKPDVQVRKPAQSGVWRTPDGYKPVGDDLTQGTGGDLKLSVKTLDDAMVLVQAVKEHRVTDNPDSKIITSAIGLEQAAVVLVRPDPDLALRLRVPVSGAQTGDTMQVSNGQPGVFYHFRPASTSAAFPLPAYFHKKYRDNRGETQNKGVCQLGIEIDFVIATDPDGGPAANPATVFPRPPLLGITPVATGSSLSSRAVKAQTGVEAEMAQVALIAAVPAIRADPDVIDYGGSAKILIPASNPQDQYQVTLKGARVKPAVTGDGSPLTVVTDAVSADAIFEVLVTRRPADKEMQVERVVQVAVLVRPDTGLPVSARPDAVIQNTGTDIVVQGSQRGVIYQLMSGQTAIGSPMPGTGAELSLPTGPISADTTFTVAATRADNAQIAVDLKAQATVKLKPGA